MNRFKAMAKAAVPYLLGSCRYLLALVPFFLMDLMVRNLAEGVNYSQKVAELPSILFSVLWVGVLVTLITSFRQKIGRIIYGIVFTLFFVLFLTNCVYYSYTDFFFSFNLLSMAEAGSAYIWDTIIGTDIWIYLAALGIVITGVLAIIWFPKRKHWDPRPMLAAVILFIFAYSYIPSLYGEAYDTLKWDAWRNPRNVYENFNDTNKCVKICGFYEYTIRDFAKAFFSPTPKMTEEEENVLEEAEQEAVDENANDYTGIFKGKNVIFLQLEGMDTWLLTQEDTPNLYGMLDNSIVFTNHYSYYNGGGSTFNSELAVNTGFITPITYYQNAYTFTSNYYPYTLPRLFKEQGYSANAFHMNNGEYYSRRLNYKNWGYDNYFGLLDIQKYTDGSQELDRELVLNPRFRAELFGQDGPFLHYMITYTPHTPFRATKGKGLKLAKEKYGDEIPEMDEEACARLYAGETDNMVGLLLEGLEEKGLLENTVIVCFADHYLYTLNDKTVLDKYKQTDNNLINHTPFFIWSYGQERVEIHKVNSQIDILPTVLNMFGIENPSDYTIGHDIACSNYPGYVFFSDYSWYDGNIYVENGEVTMGQVSDSGYLIEMGEKITQLIQRNDLVQKYDYFREVKNRK